MPFGLKGAPAHFQKFLQLTIQTEGDLSIIVYIDDILVSKKDWGRLWLKTLSVISKLVKAGFMINLQKCKFLMQRLEIVGMEVATRIYFAKQKKIEKLLKSSIPGSLKELQQLTGQLNYFRCFVPGFS